MRFFYGFKPHPQFKGHRDLPDKDLCIIKLYVWDVIK